MNFDFLSTDLPQLAKGRHEVGSQQLCAMELVAFIEREEHSDHPQCTCPVLAAYTRRWNDRVPDHLRNHILPLLPQLVGTRNEKYQIARAEYFAFAARDSACKALQGRIDLSLVEKLRNSKTIQECRVAASKCRRAAADAVDAAGAAGAYAAAAACAATANAAAYAADAADAAADAAYTADAAEAAYAASAVDAAAAADAVYAAADAVYAAYTASADPIWLDALDVLKGAIAIDPDHSPAPWTEQDYARGFAEMSA